MKNSIRKNSDFNKVYDNKKSYAGKFLVMYILKNGDVESNRLGISVSHKVGNSVVRHTLSRRMREIFKKNNERLEKPYDIVVVYRKGAEKTEFFNLNEEFIELCNKHGIYKG